MCNKFFIILLFVPNSVWSWSFFYGRLKTKVDPLTIFKTDKPSRKLVFLQLDATEVKDEQEEDFEVKREKQKEIKDKEKIVDQNLKDKKKPPNIESLMQRQFGEDLLRSLYLKFKGIPRITVSTNDLITSWDKNAKNYNIKKYSNYVIEEPDSWVDKNTRERRKSQREEIEKRKKLFGLESKEEKEKEEKNESSDKDISESEKEEKKEEVSKLPKKKLEDFTTDEIDYLSENVETLEKWKRKTFSNQTPVYETIYKRGKWEEISFFFLKEGIQYIDARLPNFDESMLKKDDEIQEILIWDKNKRGQLEKVIYRETNRYKRELKVQNSSIKILRPMMLAQIIKHLREKEQSDFAVHVKLSSGKKRGETQIQMYLIRTSSGEMELIYKNNFFISNLQKHVDEASAKLLAALQGVPLIKNIHFTSPKADTHVYLDDAFVGKTPLKLNYPAGVYKFHFWKDGYEWNPSETFTLNSEKSMLDYVPSERAKDKLAHTNLWLRIDSRSSDALVHLSFKQKEKLENPGYIYVQSHNPVPKSKVFLDNLLVGVFQKNVAFSAAPGERIISLWPPGYRGVDGIVPVRPDFVSVVDVRYLRVPNYQQIERKADIYKVSSRVLALSGGFSFLLWFTSFFLANQSWDKATLLEKIYTKTPSNPPSNAIKMYQRHQEAFNAVQYGSLYSALGLFSLGVVFKILEIKTRVTPVYNPHRQDKNFKIRYVPQKSFLFTQRK